MVVVLGAIVFEIVGVFELEWRDDGSSVASE